MSNSVEKEELEINFELSLADSIRDVVDRRVKLSIKRLVNYETKREKVENRVLVCINLLYLLALSCLKRNNDAKFLISAQSTYIILCSHK